MSFNRVDCLVKLFGDTTEIIWNELQALNETLGKQAKECAVAMTVLGVRTHNWVEKCVGNSANKDLTEKVGLNLAFVNHATEFHKHKRA